MMGRRRRGRQEAEENDRGDGYGSVLRARSLQAQTPPSRKPHHAAHTSIAGFESARTSENEMAGSDKIGMDERTVGEETKTDRKTERQKDRQGGEGDESNQLRESFNSKTRRCVDRPHRATLWIQHTLIAHLFRLVALNPPS